MAGQEWKPFELEASGGALQAASAEDIEKSRPEASIGDVEANGGSEFDAKRQPSEFHHDQLLEELR